MCLCVCPAHALNVTCPCIALPPLQNGRLINLQFPEQAHWELPGTEMLSPHDFVLGAAPTEESGVGDRFFAVYLASVGSACDKKCGPLRKFVAVPHGIEIPNAAVGRAFRNCLVGWVLSVGYLVLSYHEARSLTLPVGRRMHGTLLQSYPHARAQRGHFVSNC